jgi:hypothetical protein
MNRWGVLVGTGVAVVMSAVSGALVNELHAGWPWWVASAVVVLASAGLAMWLVARGSPPTTPPTTPPPTTPPPATPPAARRPAGGGDWRGEVRQDVKLEGDARGYVVGQGEMNIRDR